MSRQRQTRIITVDQASMRIRLAYAHALTLPGYEEEAENFFRYVLPTLAERESRPQPANHDGRFTCLFPSCRASTYASKQTYVRHLRSIHAFELPANGAFLSPKSANYLSSGASFKCLNCGKTYARRDHMNQHLASPINAKCAAAHLALANGTSRSSSVISIQSAGEQQACTEPVLQVSDDEREAIRSQTAAKTLPLVVPDSPSQDEEEQQLAAAQAASTTHDDDNKEREHGDPVDPSMRYFNSSYRTLAHSLSLLSMRSYELRVRELEGSLRDHQQDDSISSSAPLLKH